MTDTPIIDAVVIGRNEGDRLQACLQSLQGQIRRIIYVDSGSTDGSAEAARQAGAEVVDLDMSRPFTAARARNAGLERIREATLVQFVDGDCTIAPGWIEQAANYLNAHPDTAVACGRRREMHPDQSVFNRLCDTEWDTPVGDAKYCGGDAMIRTDAIRAVGGYREDLIAGEEPELCVRLRAAGWKIRRLDAEMTGHDAQITRFGQWWQRSRRSGYAFAQGAALHGAPPESHWVRERRRALVWGTAWPAAIALAGIANPVALIAIATYPLQVARLTRRMGFETAVFNTLGKFPEAQGVWEYYLTKLRGTRRDLIEYK